MRSGHRHAEAIRHLFQLETFDTVEMDSKPGPLGQLGKRFEHEPQFFLSGKGLLGRRRLVGYGERHLLRCAASKFPRDLAARVDRQIVDQAVESSCAAPGPR